MEGLESIKKGYFSYEGRLNRKVYIIRILILLMIIHFASLMGTIEVGITFDNLIGTAIIIGASIAIVMITIRRLHDLGKNWTWALLMFIPVVNIAFLIYLFIAIGYPTENEYGPNPLDFVDFK